MELYFLIIYRNVKGKIFFRLNSSPLRYEIGERTSMGWLVVDKQCYCEKLKKFVGEETMRKVFYDSQKEHWEKMKKRRKTEKILNFIYQVFK